MSLFFYQQEADKIGNKELSKAVSLALWFIINKEKPLNYALKASKKHYPIKSHVEKELRSILPDSFFIERSKQSFLKGNVTMYAIMEKEQKKHLSSIQGRLT